MDFQFDSTVDGKAVKIASMIDEHTRESLLHLVERSITAEMLVTELEKVFISRGGPTATTSRRNSSGYGFGIANILPARTNPHRSGDLPQDLVTRRSVNLRR
ncbi:hypothetical protein OG874_21770 [Nocardia sp. NBC_00565]|uniref:hypothetical protein n=1 Tax=Nocardia sp. NBC_00565 TaxID=2975993 RepID=UPI002E80F01B|nr:hypothetical protein [Nocardia sp. NBC_00565]WUC07549.1 hypothetical protein OG874_21770 [Nocardia sp. NBC_00565]